MESDLIHFMQNPLKRVIKCMHYVELYLLGSCSFRIRLIYKERTRWGLGKWEINNPVLQKAINIRNKIRNKKLLVSRHFRRLRKIKQGKKLPN